MAKLFIIFLIAIFLFAGFGYGKETPFPNESNDNDLSFVVFPYDWFAENGYEVIITLGGVNWLIISPFVFMRMEDGKIFHLVPRPKTKNQPFNERME